MYKLLFEILKAVVLHHTLNSRGGESSFAIETINSLSRLGYDIELITVQKPNLELISKTYGKIPPIKKVKYISPFSMNYFGIYQRLLTTISSLNLEPSDIVINTNGNSLPFKYHPIFYVFYIFTFLHFFKRLLNTIIINIKNLYFGKLILNHIKL